MLCVYYILLFTSYNHVDLNLFGVKKKNVVLISCRNCTRIIILNNIQ